MNKHWVSIFSFCLLVTSTTACRFGNYAEQPKPNFKESYQSIDLYFTQATSLGTAVLFQDDTYQENAHAPLVAVPTSIRNTFTNPLYFAVPIDTTANPIFVGLNQSSFVETTLDTDGKINYQYPSPVSPLWENPDCLTQINLQQVGEFDPSRTGNVTFNDGSVSPVKGHLKLTFSFTRIISGDCAADLQRLADCYTNGAGCSTDELNASVNLYDLYVRQTGVLNIADAIRVKALAYEVYFE
jgi:hypothetical protein